MSAALLGQPLAVFSSVALCDRHDHEVVVVSDGQRAYVYPLNDGAEVLGDTAVGRVGVTLTASCPVAVAYDDGCDGSLAWRLSDSEWTADADARRLLAAFGRGVEQ